MRRSCAPSALNASKRKCIRNELPSKIGTTTDCEIDGSYKWGCKGAQSSEISVSSTVDDTKFSLEKTKIFHIQWRPISNKKHKVWKGFGTLEIDLPANKVVLKDHTGKYMGTAKIQAGKVDEWVQGFEVVIANKEIQLQEPIRDHNEFWEMRKMQALNRDDYDNSESKAHLAMKTEENKPKRLPLGLGYQVLQSCKMPKTSLDISMENTRKTHMQTKKNGIVLPENSIYGNAWGTSIVKTECLGNYGDPIGLNKEEASNALILKAPSNNLQALKVSPNLAIHLRDHQREGVKFMYDCLMGFRNPGYFGCILADEMGLGKTLQVLAVAHTLLRQNPFAPTKVLIISPSSLTANWIDEIVKWLGNTERMYGYVVDAKHKIDAYKNQQHVPFIIASYETFLVRLNEFERFKFDLLICDEGHRLKNASTKIRAALNQLDIKRRIILTGTPVQNDLQEFYALADFVNPGIFQSNADFRKYFERPINASQVPEADEKVRQLGFQRSTELKTLTEKFLLRRSQTINQQYLPPKEEYICFVRPTDDQQFLLKEAVRLYQLYKNNKLKDLTPLQIIGILKKICIHPSLIGRMKPSNVLTRHLGRYLSDWSGKSPYDSAKMAFLNDFLVENVVGGCEKCVLVSNNTTTLNLVQGMCDYLNIKCLRLDGSTALGERNANVVRFNTDAGNDDALVFLLSAKAGGVGLNLSGASRLILLDNDWNPATDEQAISRIWRDGQKNSRVQIYRLITAGCIEEKILQRQIAKMTLGDSVLVEQHSNEDAMKFSPDDLKDLFVLQQEFDSCMTHDSLSCSCSGDGQNTIHDIIEVETDCTTKQYINELINWQHYQAPIDEEFLKKAGLSNASDNILYIFSHRTEKKTISN